MSDKETHVLINTEQHCVKSSLQWKGTDGGQACEVWVPRERKLDLIWHWKLQATTRSSTWTKTAMEQDGLSRWPSLVFRCIGLCLSLHSVSSETIRKAKGVPKPAPRSTSAPTPTPTPQPAGCLSTFPQQKDFPAPGHEPRQHLI